MTSGTRKFTLETFKNFTSCLKIFYFLMLLISFICFPLTHIALLDSISVDIDEPLESIKKFANLPISEKFWLPYPEFIDRNDEDKWRSLHKKIYFLLRDKKEIKLTVKTFSGLKRVHASILKPCLKEVISKTLVSHLVGLCFIISSILMFKRHKELYGLLISVFLVSCALYDLSSIPLVYRGVTLNYLYMNLFLLLNYLAGGSFVTFVHFSLIFPKESVLLKKYPYLILLLYIYFVSVTILYFAGITAFDFSLPFFFFWVGVLFFAFIGAIIDEKDEFIKLQTIIILFAPVFVSIVFVCFHVVPLMLNVSSIKFDHFILISLILAFVLPIAIDNMKIYSHNLILQENYIKERELVRRDLHDFILRKFSVISVTTHALIFLLKSANYKKMLGKINLIQQEAKLSSNDLRFFLEIFRENKKCNWNDYVKKVRFYTNKILMPHDIAVSVSAKFYYNKEIDEIFQLKIQSRVFWIISEAVSNIIIHAKATNVRLTFLFFYNSLHLEIKDDGEGFDVTSPNHGHMGLLNIKKHVQAIGGRLYISSKKGKGTLIKIIIPYPE